jgi:hypothetical protein
MTPLKFNRFMNAYSFSVAIFFVVLVLSLIRLAFQEKPVIVVGTWKIYQSDINQRNKIIKIFFPFYTSEEGGLFQLKRSAEYLKILQNHGVTITKEEILQEAKRIDLKTKDPKHLNEIKALFEGDHEAYLKNYVLSGMIDRIIAFDFFPNNSQIHKVSLAKAHQLISELQSNPNIFVVAKKNDFKVIQMSLSLSDGIIWDTDVSNEKINGTNFKDMAKVDNQELKSALQKDNQLGNLEKAQSWNDRFLKDLKDNQTYLKPINEGEFWLVLHHVKKINYGKHQLQAVLVPKISFDLWLKEELKHVYK